MTTYWAQTFSLLLTAIFLLTFVQMLKVLKMPAPTIQASSAAPPDVGRRLEHVGRLKPLAVLDSYLLNVIDSCWLYFSDDILKYDPPQPKVVQGEVRRRCWPLRLTKPRDLSILDILVILDILLVSKTIQTINIYLRPPF